MADTNWIKLNRSIWDCFLWDFSNPKYAMCWIDILLMANYKDKKMFFDGKTEIVERGTLVTSMVKLSEKWHMNRKTVKKFLDMLQADGMITYKSDNRRTTIKVLKYGLYQGFSNDDGTAEYPTERTAEYPTNWTAEGTAEWTQHKNIKNIKEDKEDKKKDITNVISKEKAERFSPPTLDDVKAYCQEKGYGIDKVDPEKFIDFYTSKGWMVGKNKMKDWKAAVRNWSRSQRQETTAKTTRKEMVPAWMNKKTKFDNFEQRDMDYDDLQKKLLEQSTGKADEP